MAIANYSDLQSAVLAWAVRTGDAEATARVPDFIKLYEADANRRIRIRQNMASGTLSLTSGTSVVSLPSDFLELIELNYNDTGDRLTDASWDTIDRSRNSTMQSGRPSLYAVDSTQILFERTADATYSLKARYYEKWDISGDSTNWLLTNAPDVYLFGAVAELALFVRDDQLLATAIGRRDAVTADLLKADSRTKRARLMVDPALLSSGCYDYRTG